MCVFPQGGTRPTPQDHVVVVDVSRVPDGHVLKDLIIRPHNIVCPGPHLPPLSHHLPHSPIPIPRSPSQEEVCLNVLNPCRCHRHRYLLFPSLSARLLQFHVEVSRKNQLCPPWLLRHCRLHVPNRSSVAQRQVTSNDVPAPLPCFQLACDDGCTELAYLLDFKGGGGFIV